jgi:hypothetical protein
MDAVLQVTISFLTRAIRCGWKGSDTGRANWTGGERPKSPIGSVLTTQAAIAAVNAKAESAVVSDWEQIVAPYDQLLRIHPSPVVQVDRAVAIQMRDRLEAETNRNRY